MKSIYFKIMKSLIHLNVTWVVYAMIVGEPILKAKQLLLQFPFFCCSIGLYMTDVTYFFLNLFVAHMTMTPSWMESAYMWFTITWLGVGNSVGSHESGVS